MSVSIEGYYSYHDDGIYIEEDAIIEYSVELDSKPPENSTFYGFVKDTDTDDPIKGAEVQFWNDYVDYHNSTWTDDSGYYEIYVPEGEFGIDIQADGYYYYNDDEIYIGEDENVEYNAELKPKPEEKSTFYGWVNDTENNKPIEEATLKFRIDNNNFNETSSNETGYYEINVPEGVFYVNIWADDYYDYYEEGIQIGEDENREFNIELIPRVEENSQLYGWVNNSETGDPIEEAQINLWIEEYNYGNSSWTNESGYYEINLPASEFEVDFLADGYYDYWEGEIYIEEDEILEYSVELDTKPLENSLFYGWVNDSEFGEPIEGLEVNFWDDREYDNASYTDENGFYEIYVPKGEFYVSVSIEGYYSYNDYEIYIEEDEKLEYSIILDPLPPENSLIYGWVNNSETDEPIVDAEVSLWFGEYNYGNSTSTDDSGYYEINVPECEVDIHVRVTGFFNHDEWEIYIEEDDVFEYTVFLNPLPPENSIFYGWVNDSNSDEPIEGVLINFHFIDHNYWNSTYTDESGYYEINVPEGEINFQVTMERYYDYSDDGIYIKEDERREYNVDLEYRIEDSKFYGWISSSKTGESIEGVRIYCEENFWNNTRTDENGYYEIKVPEGEFRIYLLFEGFFLHIEDGVYIEKGEWKEYSREIEPIIENSTFYGLIRDKKSKEAIESAQVNFRIMDRQIYLYGNDTQTNEFGLYDINVPEGDFEVYIWAEGYFAHNEEGIYIDEDEKKEYSIELESIPQENGILKGYVKDSKTNELFVDVEIQIEDNEHLYINSTWTDEFGFYEIYLYEGDWEIKVDVGDYIEHIEDIYIEDFEERWYNIYLEPIPPQNATIKGNIKDENGYPIDMTDRDGGINAYHLQFEEENNTSPDEQGYFEFDVWSGWSLFVVNIDDFYINSKILFLEHNEIYWYNITLNDVLDNDGTIRGNIIDEDDEPIEDASVYLVIK